MENMNEHKNNAAVKTYPSAWENRNKNVFAYYINIYILYIQVFFFVHNNKNRMCFWPDWHCTFDLLEPNRTIICNAVRKDLFKLLTIYFVGTDNSNKFFSFGFNGTEYRFSRVHNGYFKCMKSPYEWETLSLLNLIRALYELC